MQVRMKPKLFIACAFVLLREREIIYASQDEAEVFHCVSICSFQRQRYHLCKSGWSLPPQACLSTSKTKTLTPCCAGTTS